MRISDDNIAFLDSVDAGKLSKMIDSYLANVDSNTLNSNGQVVTVNATLRFMVDARLSLVDRSLSLGKEVIDLAVNEHIKAYAIMTTSSGCNMVVVSNKELYMDHTFSLPSLTYCWSAHLNAKIYFQELDLRSVRFDRAISLKAKFYNLNIGNLRLGDVVVGAHCYDLSGMFAKSTIQNIEIGSMQLLNDKVSFNGMFMNSKIGNIDLSRIDFKHVKDMANMFRGATIYNIAGLEDIFRFSGNGDVLYTGVFENAIMPNVSIGISSIYFKNPRVIDNCADIIKNVICKEILLDRPVVNPTISYNGEISLLTVDKLNSVIGKPNNQTKFSGVVVTCDKPRDIDCYIENYKSKLRYDCVKTYCSYIKRSRENRSYSISEIGLIDSSGSYMLLNARAAINKIKLGLIYVMNLNAVISDNESLKGQDLEQFSLLE